MALVCSKTWKLMVLPNAEVSRMPKAAYMTAKKKRNNGNHKA